MSDYKITPSNTRADPSNPNWTKPRTFGVWELPPGSGGKRYRFGNYPVRGKELVHEYGAAKLIELYTSRLAARSHAAKLN